MLRVLTLATLFPDAVRPNFGVFVERQTLGLAALDDVEVRVVAPLGLPPFPLSLHSGYRSLSRLPQHEVWKGLPVDRPRFLNLPATQGRFHVAALVRRLVPHLVRLREDFPFDVIDAEFFFPDGPAAVALGRRFGVPVSIKARGADIHHWGHAPATAAQVRAAGRAADGLLAVSQSMADDIAATGIDRPVRVHRTGIDRSRFGCVDRMAARQRLGITGPLVVSLGALIPRKGHRIVLDAVAALPGVGLWIVGGGPDQAALAARIAELGIGDRVTLCGALPHGDLPDLLAAADVMALASSSEGLANAWVEALASGTPIVIPDAGAAREVVTVPAAGRIVARESSAFAQGIAAVLSQPVDRQATQAVVEAFSWERNALELRAHLAGLVAGRRSD
ncbi:MULTISPECIES: glycosyltransferase [unclassified Sphingomonas]|uniref:glycosyltransferase n=1 Tax=unclassified Sphingomonas TaxID=196159 RepID=UPI0006FF141A|nr:MULTISPECIES: glycosyltransferase [unclassified Sphingomonas]KQM61383.1 glycoside hydrolase [Sphingomonas sp. Leaf16]KQN12478.1 glycoside hydrolase [Sphingomonas sp. Leaf29]KQN18959.1 glycoside hydrolase [Sphingomonas sp. Leaf32]